MHGKFDTSTRRGKVTVSGNTVYCSVSNFINYANAQGFFAYEHDENTPTNNQPVVTNSYTRYVKANGGLNVRNAPNGSRIGGLADGTQVIVYESQGNWSRIAQGWVCNTYLVSSKTPTAVQSYSKVFTTGRYKVNASLLNVRYGAGTNYKSKTYVQLSANARQQNKTLGNYYANGYKKGVVCTVTKISGHWGLTASGWICLDYCTKL